MKNNVLDFIEKNNYSLREIRGTPVPIFVLASNDDIDNELQITFMNESRYQFSRSATDIEQQIAKQISQEIKNYKNKNNTNDLKFISYDFFLDNNE